MENNFTPEFISYLYKFFTTNKEDLCEYCKNKVPCNETECDCYEVFGKPTSVIINGVEKPYNGGTYDFTCMDLNFGECPKLEDTPCALCAKDNFGKSFSWNGIIPNDINIF